MIKIVATPQGFSVKLGEREFSSGQEVKILLKNGEVTEGVLGKFEFEYADGFSGAPFFFVVRMVKIPIADIKEIADSGSWAGWGKS